MSPGWGKQINRGLYQVHEIYFILFNTEQSIINRDLFFGHTIFALVERLLPIGVMPSTHMEITQETSLWKLSLHYWNHAGGIRSILHETSYETSVLISEQVVILHSNWFTWRAQWIMVTLMCSPLHWLSERPEPTFQLNSELLHGPLKLYDTISSFFFLNLKNLHIKFSYYKCNTWWENLEKYTQRKYESWYNFDVQPQITCFNSLNCLFDFSLCFTY